MTSINCEFCFISLKSKYNLKYHLLNSKKCLKLRGEIEQEITCICKLSFSIKNFEKHQHVCKQYIENTIRQECNLKIMEMKSNYEKTIKDLQIQNEKLIDSLQKLASQAIDKPTVTNIKNSFSDKYFLESISYEDVKRKCQNYLTEEVFLEGQKGIAKLCTDHIIKTKDKKALMVCTDTSRKKFKYIDENGNMKEDFEARTFSEKVSKPIKDVSKILYENILSDVKSEKQNLEDTNYSRKAFLNDKELKTIDCFVKINCFDSNQHNSDFKTELAILNK